MNSIDVLNDILNGRVDGQAVRNLALLLKYFVEVLIKRRNLPAIVVLVSTALSRQVTFNDCQLIASLLRPCVILFLFLPNRSNDEALLIGMVNDRVEGLIFERILVDSLG